jgi:ATP-dependent DNA helicase RecG
MLELMSILELTHRAHINEKYFNVLFKNGLIEVIIPDKPKRPNQKYRISNKGKGLL